MPRKLRRAKVRLDQLTLAQKAHLETGHYYFDYDGEADRFVDAQHRRQAWAVHRETLLAEHDRVGHRPRALWEYDVPGGWEAHGETEADAVRTLVLAGNLAPCRRDGLVRVDDEVAEIEDQWRREIQIYLGSSRDRPLEIAEPLRTWGCPRWFYAQHAPAVLAEIEAEAAAFRASLRQPGNGAGCANHRCR